MEKDRSKLTSESLKMGLSKLTGVDFLQIQLKGYGIEDGIEKIEKELLKKFGTFFYRCANCKFDIPDLNYCPFCGAIFSEEKELTDKTVQEIEDGLKELNEEELKIEIGLEEKLPLFYLIKRFLPGREYIIKDDGSVVFQNKTKTKNIIRIYPNKIKFRYYEKMPKVKKVKNTKSYEAIYRGKDKDIIRELTKLARKKKGA